MANSGERSRLSEKLSRIIQYDAACQNGVSGDQANLLLKPIKVEAVRVEQGRETKDSSGKKFLEVVVMVMLLYMAVLLYGISVMRSVLEEKNSRVMEVLLSSATSTELMTGKTSRRGRGRPDADRGLGVDRRRVRSACSGHAAWTSANLQFRPAVLVAFAAFFLLGYSALQHDLCRDRGDHHDRAGRPATPVLRRDSAGALGVHAESGRAERPTLPWSPGCRCFRSSRRF